MIKQLFFQSKERYGYKRITMEIQKLGHCINHKKGYRLMQEMGLKCVKFMRKSRTYNSYKGKVRTVSKNRLNRRFHTNVPLQKLVTDVTEFKCMGNEKLYLSPILDLYNGEVIAYGISKRPSLEFVLKPLGEAVGIVRKHGTVRTAIHSNHGWQYQHKQWTKTLKQNKIFQSMSRKATCADNAVMKNFFGILKQEMYHGEKMMSYDELELRISEYIHWYNHVRSKEKLPGLSPVEYRAQTSQFAV